MINSANLTVMIKAARRAARSLLKDFQEVEALTVSMKSAGDFVSRADIAAEKIIREELSTARPNYGWIGEESAAEEGKDPTRYWVVDPLDGTTNFLHGLPHWAVSIALQHKDEIVASVIYDPCKDEMFFAEKGQGAWMNQTRLRVSARSHMIEAIFATGLPFGGRTDLPATLQDLARLLPMTAGVRRWGAASLDLAYVAAGRYDGYWERRLKPWDVAAGVLLVKEAGGMVEPLQAEGAPILKSGELVAANSNIFNTFTRTLRSH